MALYVVVARFRRSQLTVDRINFKAKFWDWIVDTSNIPHSSENNTTNIICGQFITSCAITDSEPSNNCSAKTGNGDSHIIQTFDEEHCVGDNEVVTTQTLIQSSPTTCCQSVPPSLPTDRNAETRHQSYCDPSNTQHLLHDSPPISPPQGIDSLNAANKTDLSDIPVAYIESPGLLSEVSLNNVAVTKTAETQSMSENELDKAVFPVEPLVYSQHDLTTNQKVDNDCLSAGKSFEQTECQPLSAAVCPNPATNIFPRQLKEEESVPDDPPSPSRVLSELPAEIRTIESTSTNQVRSNAAQENRSPEVCFEKSVKGKVTSNEFV